MALRWLHLQHEDFAGQHGKFWANYSQFPCYQKEERVQKVMAAKLDFSRTLAFGDFRLRWTPSCTSTATST